MKKLLISAALVLAVLSGTTVDVMAQRVNIGVSVRPQAPHYRRPPMPARGFVWIGESWRWHRGRYVFVPGYWMRPPSRHARYVQGRWERNRNRWVWLDGYWTGRYNGRDRQYDNDWDDYRDGRKGRGHRYNHWED